MPKQKTNSGTTKRFRLTKNGVKHKSANRNHILTKKRMKRKRHLRNAAMVHPSDIKSIYRLLNVM